MKHQDGYLFINNTKLELSGLSPIVSLTIGSNQNNRQLNFLIDTGSQVSLVNQTLAAPFSKIIQKSTKEFACFNNTFQLNCSTIKTQLSGPLNKPVSCELIAVQGFNIKYVVPQLKRLVEEQKKIKRISPSFLKCVESIRNGELKVHGLLGVDLVAQLVRFSIVSSDTCCFAEVGDGLVPMGSVASPLHVHCVEQVSTTTSALQSARRKQRKPPKGNRFKGCQKASKNEVCSAVHQMCITTRNRFDVLPDFAAEHMQQQLTVANSYGESEDDKPLNDFNHFKNNITFKNNKYQVKVPFQPDILQKVPSNYSVCKVLAKKVHQKLPSTELKNQYFDYFQDQVQNDIITPLEENFDISSHKFIPHRPIFREDPLVKTTKIRGVFNCSFRNGKSPSLNDCVEFPQDSMKDLVDLFLYFRANKYFLTADIKQAFLNVKLASVSDSRMFSFIVYHNNQFYHFRYTTVLFGFVMGPFFLNSVLKFHASLQPDPSLSNYLENHFYIDNLVVVSESKNHLAETAADLYESLEDAGFHLREWNSNVDGVTTQIPAEDNLCNTTEPFKVLGMVHNPVEDTFALKKLELDANSCTKRQCLSGIASIFDPCGHVLPVSSYGKLLLRKITKLGLSWDDAIPMEISSMWQTLVKQMEKLSNKVSVPRYAYSKDKPFSLHCFLDASQDLIGTAVYVVQDNKSSLLFAKCKLAPARSRTIPTLELLAIELACKVIHKLINSVYFSLNMLQKIHFYSDSQIALSWVLTRMAPKRNLFACHRVKTINTLLDGLTAKNLKFEIAYIQTTENAADMLTRPRTALRFLRVLEYYHQGPAWLTQGGPPPSALQSIPVRHIKDKKLIYNLQVNESQSVTIDLNRFSSYNKAVNTLAYVYKFLDLLRKNEIQPFVIYRAKATTHLIALMQSSYFPIELNHLTNTEGLTKKAPKLASQLHLFLDQEGLLRSKGRISESQRYSYDITNPLVVAGDSLLGKLLVNYAHGQCKHMGTNSTLYYLRNLGFWLTKARASIARIIGQCPVCIRHRARTFETPPPSLLPGARTEFYRPFSCVGMDYTGHFRIRDESGKVSKSYILLFTCMTTRAVHLELVSSMGVHEFLNAFKRFSGLYGLPEQVFSDNAKTFTASAGLLKSLVEHDMVRDFLATKNIWFKTIPVYSPSQGGTWERMVGVVKTVLIKTYGKSTHTFDDFRTILSEVQLVVNSRPLCYLPSSQDLEVVTPIMLLNKGNTIPLMRFDQRTIERAWENAGDRQFLQGINAQIAQQEHAQDQFMEEWLRAYILDLRSKHGSNGPSDGTRQTPRWVKIGSVCLHKTPVASTHYPLVIITKLLPGRDGGVRNVAIKNSRGVVSIASIANLSPLEIDADDNNETNPSSASTAQIKNSYSAKAEKKPPDSSSVAIEATAASSSSARPIRRAAAASRQSTKLRAQQGLI